MLYTDKNIGETYCAPFLGNGKLSLQITPDGAMNPSMRGRLIKAYPVDEHLGRRTQEHERQPRIALSRPL